MRYGPEPFWWDSVGRNLADRGKADTKRSILVDAGGGHLSLAVAGANVRDTKLLTMAPERVVVERPEAEFSICAWIRGTTIRQGIRHCRPTDTEDTSGGLER